MQSKIKKEVTVKVLWISRHRPGDTEATLLAEMLDGADIVPITGTVPSTWALRELLDEYEPDAIVATLPIDMQEILIGQLRYKKMRPLIRPLYRHRRSDAPGDEWEFMGFEEILDVSIKSRPLKRIEEKGKDSEYHTE